MSDTENKNCTEESRMQSVHTCDYCLGAGAVFDGSMEMECPECFGSGVFEVTESDEIENADYTYQEILEIANELETFGISKLLNGEDVKDRDAQLNRLMTCCAQAVSALRQCAVTRRVKS